jgi:hypothetical protein
MAEGDFPDVEGAVREYLMAQGSVNALGSGFFAIPDKPTFPLFVVSRVGGGDDTSEAVIDQALIQIDVWGPTRAEQRGGKATTTAMALAIRSVLRAIRGLTALNATVSAYGAEVISMVTPPDPRSDRPRYALTVAVTARVHA